MALGTRIVTAVVAAPVAVGLILYLPAIPFAAVSALLFVGALHEWVNLTTGSRGGFVVAAGTLIAICIALMLLGPVEDSPVNSDLLPWLCAIGSALWIYQLWTLTRGIGYRRSPRLELGLGLMTVICAWAAMVWLHGIVPRGPRLVLLAMLVVWAADSFAYFAGRAVGRRKLAPSISPGKTVEGVIGGFAGALITAWIMSDLLGLGGHIALWGILLAAGLAALVSVVGDLSVSRLKRQAGIKDSGRLLPGHGGLLDRIDGLLAALPVFALAWWILQ